MRELPLSVDDTERNVFVRWPGAEVQEHGLVVTGLLDDLVRRRLGLVDEVRVEDVELRDVSATTKTWMVTGRTLYPCTTLGGGLSVLLASQ